VTFTIKKKAKTRVHRVRLVPNYGVDTGNIIKRNGREVTQKVKKKKCWTNPKVENLHLSCRPQTAPSLRRVGSAMNGRKNRGSPRERKKGEK